MNARLLIVLGICAFVSRTPAVVLAGQERSLTEADTETPTGPTPRTADGHPDFSGYWKGTKDTVPVGNIGKDLPDHKLPLTPAGEPRCSTI